MALLILPSCFGLAALTPLVMPLLFGEAFAQAVPVTIILLIATGVTSVTVVGTNIIWALERSDMDFYAGILGAVASVSGAFALIQPFGLIGAGLSRAVAQLLAVSLSTWFLQRKLDVRPPYEHLAKLLVSAIASSLVAYLLITFFPYAATLTVAIPLAAITYALAIRAFKALHEDEMKQLLLISDMMPKRLGSPFRRLVMFVGKMS
jgi:O-antigen/teichoic acid export membrane protein